MRGGAGRAGAGSNCIRLYGTIYLNYSGITEMDSLA